PPPAGAVSLTRPLLARLPAPPRLAMPFSGRWHGVRDSDGSRTDVPDRCWSAAHPRSCNRRTDHAENFGSPWRSGPIALAGALPWSGPLFGAMPPEGETTAGAVPPPAIGRRCPGA